MPTEESRHHGSIRPFLLALALLMGTLSAIPPGDIQFVSPTRHSSYGNAIRINVTFASADPASCMLSVLDPIGQIAYLPMALAGKSCYAEIGDVMLGNYSYYVSITDFDGEMAASAAYWTVGQYCDANLVRNLTLGGDLEGELALGTYCFELGIPGVTLDCNGHTISLASGIGNAAILMGGSGTSVKNCIISGWWQDAYILVSDFVGSNQTNFSIINNSFDPLEVPQWGDIAVDFSTPAFADEVRIERNTIRHGVLVSGNVLNLEFIGNSLSGSPSQSTPFGGEPNALLYEEQGEGEGARDNWLVSGNIFEVRGSASCVSAAGNALGGSHETEYVNNNCTTDDAPVQLINGIGNFTVINSSFTPFDASLFREMSAASFIRLGWYVYVNATDAEGRGVASANVTYFDSSGFKAGTLLTDGSGKGRFSVLESIIGSVGGEIRHTPHLFKANKDACEEELLNVTVNSTMQIMLVVDDLTPPQQLDFTPDSVSSATPNPWIFVNLTFADLRPGGCLLQLDDTVNITMTRDGTDCYWNATGLEEGAHNYSVIVNDTNGRSNATGVRTVVVDATSPRNFLVLPPSASGTIDSNWFHVNVSFEEQNTATCVLNVNGSSNFSMSVNGNVAYGFASDLPGGEYRYSVICSDAAGNSNRSGTRLVIVELNASDYFQSSSGAHAGDPGDKEKRGTASLTIPRPTPVKSPKPPNSAFPARSESTEDALFDIVVQVLEKNLAPGGIPAAKISLTKFNAAGKISVDILYEIRDGTGKAIRVARETRIVELTEDFIVSLGLPDGAPSGKYELYAKITYGGGKVAESSDTFEYSPTGRGAAAQIADYYYSFALGILLATTFLCIWKFKKSG